MGKADKADKAILLFLAAVFLFTAIDKLVHLEGFVNALRSYSMVPRGTAEYIAMPIILVELLIGIGLLIRSWRRPAAMAAAVILALFTAVLGIDHLLGGRGICGCWFTLTLARSTGMHIVQNLILCALSLMLWSSLRDGENYQRKKGGYRETLLASARSRWP